MTVTLEPWMTVPLAITCLWLCIAVLNEENELLGFCASCWLAMTVPALLVAWLK